MIIPKYSKNIKPSYHLFIINVVFKKLKRNKDHFMNYLKKRNIFAQYHYIPINKFKVFSEKKIKLFGSEQYFKNSISIPIFVNLNNNDQRRVVKVIKNYFNKKS